MVWGRGLTIMMFNGFLPSRKSFLDASAPTFPPSFPESLEDAMSNGGIDMSPSAGRKGHI